jgi:hypothetical protein
MVKGTSQATKQATWNICRNSKHRKSFNMFFDIPDGWKNHSLEPADRLGDNIQIIAHAIENITVQEEV